MKTDNRTTQQNNAYWQFQTWIAEEMNSQSIPLANLVTEIKPKPTKEALHLIFKSIAMVMYQKDSTTQLTREEMQNILDVYMIALAKT
jgi:hypothetical protein